MNFLSNIRNSDLSNDRSLFCNIERNYFFNLNISCSKNLSNNWSINEYLNLSDSLNCIPFDEMSSFNVNLFRNFSNDLFLNLELYCNWNLFVLMNNNRLVTVLTDIDESHFRDFNFNWNLNPNLDCFSLFNHIRNLFLNLNNFSIPNDIRNFNLHLFDCFSDLIPNYSLLHNSFNLNNLWHLNLNNFFNLSNLNIRNNLLNLYFPNNLLPFIDSNSFFLNNRYFYTSLHNSINNNISIDIYWYSFLYLNINRHIIIDYIFNWFFNIEWNLFINGNHFHFILWKYLSCFSMNWNTFFICSWFVDWILKNHRYLNIFGKRTEQTNIFLDI